MNTQRVPIERLPVGTAPSAQTGPLSHGTQSRRGRDAVNETTIIIKYNGHETQRDYMISLVS